MGQAFGILSLRVWGVKVWGLGCKVFRWGRTVGICGLAL